MSTSIASYLREPITVPRREIVAGYRGLAERYREMAAVEERPFIRDGFLELARQFEAAAASSPVENASNV